VRTEDSVALRDLVDRYADAIDRRDEDALRSLFTEDGVLRVQADDGPPESEWTGPDVVQSLDAVRGYAVTLHHIGSCVFDEETADHATGRVRCLAHHYDRTGNGPVDLVMTIVYHDRYARQADGWRIAERRVAIQWTELHPAHPKRRSRP
jgi:hypothetical protein